TDVVRTYRRRMQIEQSFRDFKTHLGVRGLQLKVRVTERLGRLLLAFCLAYALLVLLGATPAGHRARRDLEVLRRTPRHGTGRMRVAAVFHTGLTVSDLDRSIAFYRDLLGLELVTQWESAQPYLRTVVGFPEAELRIALLRLPGAAAGVSGHHLELLEYRAPRGARGDPRTCNPGNAHV